MTATLPDTTQAAFLAAIRANLADDAPRLIYADWLDENGQGERAEFVRIQIEIIRLQKIVDKWVRTPSHLQDGDMASGGTAGEALADKQNLQRREVEILRSVGLNWLPNVPKTSQIETDTHIGYMGPAGGPRFVFSRGFISRVSAPFGVLCGERCERCRGRRSGHPTGTRYELFAGRRGKRVKCDCNGSGRTPGVLRDIVRSECAAVEYIEATDKRPLAVADGRWRWLRVYGEFNETNPSFLRAGCESKAT